MNWTELIEEVAAQQDLPKTQVRRVLDAMSEVALAELARGGSVTFKRVGTVSVKVRPPRAIRSIATSRRMLLGERHVVRFRSASAAKRAVGGLSSQDWRDDRHQGAWRAAETLIGDLALYHGVRAPKTLPREASDTDTEAICAESFGGLWDRVRRSYRDGVPSEVRDHADYLAEAARRRWGI